MKYLKKHEYNAVLLLCRRNIVNIAAKFLKEETKIGTDGLKIFGQLTDFPLAAEQADIKELLPQFLEV